jgi:hypothetical protein
LSNVAGNAPVQYALTSVITVAASLSMSPPSLLCTNEVSTPPPPSGSPDTTESPFVGVPETVVVHAVKTTASNTGPSVARADRMRTRPVCP